LIAYLGPASADDTHDVAAILVDEFIQNGRNAAVVSPITAMELLVRPLQVSPPGASHVHAFLTHTPNLTLLPIDLHVAQEAASLRATHSFKTPDAFVIATGVVSQVHHLVTNDKQWRAKLAPLKSRVAVTLLRDYI
jgi:PIN domain nuclease of toxin-antitoxin system